MQKIKYLKEIILSGLACILLAVLCSSCGIISGEKEITKKEYARMIKGSFGSADDVAKLFPKSAKDVQTRLDFAMETAKADLKKLLELPDSDRTFKNTVLACDEAERRFDTVATALYVTKMVSPDKALRDVCHEAVLKAQAFVVDSFLMVDLYKAFKAYADGNAKKENLSETRSYCLNEIIKGLEHAGLHLPSGKLAKVKKLQKEISELAIGFGRNIDEDPRTVTKTLDELAGTSQSFIDSLEKDASGAYIIRPDTPSYSEIRRHCSVSDTRRDLLRAISNKGYPANKEILEKMISKRDELAKLIGFSSYADFDLDRQMAKSVNTAEGFIKELIDNVRPKENQEYKRLTDYLKENPDVFPDIKLQNNKINLWDLYYLQETYKKKNYNIDDREIAEYFPMEQTISGVFDIYEKFLNLDFNIIKPSGFWHEDVLLIEVRKKNSKLVECYLLIDLHPRKGKYSHACHICLSPSITPRDGEHRPYVGVVIANFPKSTKDKPSLLKHSDVTTFFHEFGHAVHGFLGRTELAGAAGTSTKHDFVEVPSQMFEEWMWNKEILKKTARHYKTNEPISDSLIDKMVDLKKFDRGYFIQRQCYYSLLSLDYYKEGTNKDLEKINKSIWETVMSNVAYDINLHNYASFGHLTGYAAKYYCYMWSLFIALDFFKNICKPGLLDWNQGKQVYDKVLSKGGSVDPMILSKDLLGREPNQEAFLEDIGVSDLKGKNMAEEKAVVYSFFGPPGTGKGTVAQKLVKDSGYTMLSTGDLCRKHIQEATELGQSLESYIKSGQLVPDDLITQMVLEWLKDQIAASNKIILDGFPRTKGQASLFLEALSEDSALSSIDFKIVNFDLAEEEIVKRISSRLMCSNRKCNEVYSTLVKPTKEPGICDVCKSPVIRRSDDEAAIVRERLNVFSKTKSELLSFYEESDKQAINFTIPEGPPEVVFAAFNKLLA